jgi:septum formation protein
VTRNPALVLASNSPRRKELLTLGGWLFRVVPADIDESVRNDECPATHVKRLAEEKAGTCEKAARPGEVVIAADTIVTLEGRILGKPPDREGAVDMLRQLRGRVHQVFTGFTVQEQGSPQAATGLCITSVPMRLYTEEEIDSYVDTGDPLDKAGAYAIQHTGFHPVESFTGCQASVMGLPLCHLARTLRSLGILPGSDIATACQAALHYECPIHARVLAGADLG